MYRYVSINNMEGVNKIKQAMLWDMADHCNDSSVS
jgi:hypothetical protein